MAKDEFVEEIERARGAQSTRRYTAAEVEKLRQKAARIFERYETEMSQRMLEQQREEYIREHHLYS